MNAARAAHDEALHAAVRCYLKNIAANSTTEECTSSAIQSAFAVFHSAVADFSEEWNSTVTSVASRLPTELLVECFRRLSYRDRLTASKVSRAWRSAIVGTPTFWTSISFSHRLKTRAAVTRLRNMVERSRPAVIDLNWQADAVAAKKLRYSGLEDEVHAVFAECISRIGSLAICDSPDFQFLTSLQAENLATLIAVGSAPYVPARWIGNCAPRLRHLTFSPFILPANSERFPMCSVEEFKGRIHPDNGTALRDLFAWFPRLVSLELDDVKNVADLPDQIIPTLSNIKLSGKSVDFSAVLCRWTVPPLGKKRVFKLRTDLRPPAVNAALQHLATAQPSCLSAGSISMELEWNSRIALFSDADGEYDIQIILDIAGRDSEIADPPTISAVASLHGNPNLRLVRSLFLSRDSLPAVLGASLDLPALETLTIRDAPEYSSNAWHAAIHTALTMHMPPLRGPSLREIVFDLYPMYSSRAREKAWRGARTVAHLAEFMEMRVQLGEGRKLARVVILQYDLPDWQDVSGLNAFTSKIYHAYARNGPRLEIISPSEAAEEKELQPSDDSEWED